MGGRLPAPTPRTEAAENKGSSHKAVINVFLPGYPSHLDMFDMKPEASREFRGEFSPISTNVPRMQICELFPKLAKIADKFSIIRSSTTSEGAHSGYQCMTGRTRRQKPLPPPAVGQTGVPGIQTGR